MNGFYEQLDTEQLFNDGKYGLIGLSLSAVFYHVTENASMFTCFAECSLLGTVLSELYQIMVSVTLALMMVVISAIIYIISLHLIDRYTVENGGEAP